MRVCMHSVGFFFFLIGALERGLRSGLDTEIFYHTAGLLLSYIVACHTGESFFFHL